MPSIPNEISIKFTADDKGLEKVLKNITAAQQKHNKITQASTKATQKNAEAESQAAIKIKEHLNSFKQLTKAAADNFKVTVKGADAKRANATALKKENAQAKARISTLKKSIISRHKATEAAKKQAKANAILQVSIKSNRKQLKKIQKDLIANKSSFKKLGVSASVLKQALDGDARAMASVSRASKILNKSLKKVNTGLFSITNNGRLVVGSFATIRSKMLLVSFAASLVSKVVLSNVEAFGKQQDSVNRLAAVYGGEGARSLAAYASELQKVTTFGDENINAAMAQIGAFGANTDETKKLTKATLDLSIGMGVDLNTASLLIAKSFGTSTNALGRYGIELDSSMTKQEKMDAIVSQTSDKYGGLALQLAQTTSGQLQQARNAFGDFGENIGQVLAPVVLGLAKGLKVLSEALSPAVIKTTMTAVMALTVAYQVNKAALYANAAGIGIWKAASIAATVASGGLTAALQILKLAFISTGFGAIAVALGTVVTAFVAYKSATEESNFIIDENGKKVKKLTDEEIALLEAQKEGEKELRKKIALLHADNDLKKALIETDRELSKEEQNLIQRYEEESKNKKEQKRLDDVLKSSYQSTTQAKIDSLTKDIEIFQAAEIKNRLTAKEIEGLRELEKQRNKLIKQKSDEGKTEEEIRLQTLLDSTYQGLLKTKRDQAVADVRELRIQEQKGLLSKEEIAALRELEKRRNKLNDELDASLDKDFKVKQAAIESGKALKEQAEVLKLRTQLGRELTEVEKVNLEFGKLATAQQLEYASAIDEVNEKIKKQTEVEQVKSELKQQASEIFNQITDGNISRAQEEGNAQIAEINRLEQAELESLRAKWTYKQANDKAKEAMEKQITAKRDKEKEKIRKKQNKQIVANFRMQQAVGIAEAVMNTSLAYTKVLGQTGIFGLSLAPMVAAMGAIQIAMIASQKPPKMEQGGLIGGRRHSQGGTMIEAERGEFVVSRAGVEATGIETLNKINSGAGSSNTSININNPMLGKDTIEDEIVPQIKEALRRGGDIGIN